jgi:hypothetical protein
LCLIRQEEEQMAKYAEEEAALQSNREMGERIAQRKRELAEKKAREEEEQMAKYAQEEQAQQQATAAMADRIAARKRELAEKKAREVGFFLFFLIVSFPSCPYS